MSGSSEDFRLNITAHDGATATMAKIRSELGGISKAGSAIKNAFAGFLAFQGVSEIGGFLKSSLDGFAEAEAAQIQLQRVLKTTGGQAGVTAAEISELAEATMMSTKFDDDVTLQAAAQLARFKNISGSMFKETLLMSQDMATVLGMDLTSAAEMLGKALSDPAEGMSKLKRAGVLLGEDKEKLVKYFQESGDAASAQAVIMAELRKQFEGAASAEQNTFGGQLAKMNNMIGELKESIGEKLAPVVIELLAAINASIGGKSSERTQSELIRKREISGKGETKLASLDQKIKDAEAQRGALNSAIMDMQTRITEAPAVLMDSVVHGTIDRMKGEIFEMERERNELTMQINRDRKSRPDIAAQAAKEQQEIIGGMRAADDKKAAEEQARIKKKADEEVAKQAEKLKRESDRAEKQKLRDDIGLAEDRAEEIRRQIKGEFGADQSFSATESRTRTAGSGNINDQVRQDQIKQLRAIEAVQKSAEEHTRLLKELLKKKELEVNVVGS